jgi:hypothetical protein
MLRSPFHGAMTSRFATPPEQIPLEEDAYGFHLPKDVSQSWQTLEISCLQIATILRTSFVRDYPDQILECSTPPNPSHFGYLKSHVKEHKARYALSQSLDAFVLLLAYVSFFIAICRAPEDPASISLMTSTKPRWFRELSDRIHPEFFQFLADSPISGFTTTPHSYISQASFPEFIIGGHYYKSPNQQEEPPTISFNHSKSLPDDASVLQLRGRIWALDRLLEPVRLRVAHMD